MNDQQATTPAPGASPPQGPYPYPVFCPPYPAEDTVSLIDLLRILRRRWCIVALVTILGTSAAITYALRATPIFRAQAVIAPPEQKKAGGATAALAAFGGVGAEIAGSMGFSLGGSDANRLEALLKSHRLLARVVSKHDLLPVLFRKDWDEKKKAWKGTDPGKIPNMWDADNALKKIFSVRNDSKSGILTLTLEFPQVETAQRILQFILQELALTVQEDELRKIELNKAFVEIELRRSSDPAIVAKLQTLLSDQVEKAMMARNVEHFAFELIDPPGGSDKRFKPRRYQIAALGLTGSAIMGLFLAFVWEWLIQVKKRPKDGTI